MCRKLIIALLIAMTSIAPAMAQQLNRDIGQYPGSPDENFAPTVTAATSVNYRNLALHRTVTQSSAWDYNLTSQLLTDGIIHNSLPTMLRVSTPDGMVPANHREASIDGNEWTCNTVTGSDTWLQMDWQGMTVDADDAELVCRMAYDKGQATGGYRLRLLTSHNGKTWHVADEVRGDSLPGRASRYMAHSDPNKNTGDGNLPTRNIDEHFSLKGVPPFSHLRLELVTPGAIHWTITELRLTKDGHRATGVLPATQFTSAWMSAGGEQEWVMVDLGADAAIDKVKLHWITPPASADVVVSDDGNNWRNAATLKDIKTLAHRRLNSRMLTHDM